MLNASQVTAAAESLLNNNDANLLPLLRFEKLLHRQHRAGRVPLFRRMTQISEDDQRAVGDVVVEASSVVGGNQAVASAPDDEGCVHRLSPNCRIWCCPRHII